MIEYIDKPSHNHVQVYSERKEDVLNFLHIFNAIIDTENEDTYLCDKWIRLTKDKRRLYYIEVFGKAYKRFDEAIEYFKNKSEVE